MFTDHVITGERDECSRTEEIVASFREAGHRNPHHAENRNPSNLNQF
jgi:hypothetical protein